MSQLIFFKLKAGIATLTLNRPEKRNALNEELVTSLLKCLEEINYNPDIRIVILHTNEWQGFLCRG